MRKLKLPPGKEVCTIVYENRFKQVRKKDDFIQKGSYIILQKQSDHQTITVPIPNHPEIETGTLRCVIRQSQLPKELSIQAIKQYNTH